MSSNEPLVIASSDTHVGPRLKEQLRDYCPSRYLEAFDDYVVADEGYRRAVQAEMPEKFTEVAPGRLVRKFHNTRTLGHNDVAARLQDMDYDGVAAEVIFHGSINDEPIPFTPLTSPSIRMIFQNSPPENPELDAVGRHIYNQWLADFCSTEPDRHVGLAHLPVWDIDAAIRELEWARSAGLRGVNFPTPRSWLPQFNRPEWEPFWAAAADLEMPLTTHFGAGSDADYSGPDGIACAKFEMQFSGAARALPYLIYSGVFERHPKMKYVITEIPGRWWSSLLEELDSTWRDEASVADDPWHKQDFVSPSSPNGRLIDMCPRPPSEYCRENVFVGASFMSHLEAVTASEGDYGNFMWGSDYPHPEGTFHHPDDRSSTPTTHVALQFAFGGLPEDHIRRMLGGNLIEVYGLDGAKLADVAARINPPRMELFDKSIPVPSDAHGKTYRTRGTWD